MEWILYSNVGGLYLSGKDSGSNPFGMTQVSLSLSIHTHIKLPIMEVILEYS